MEKKGHVASLEYFSKALFKSRCWYRLMGFNINIINFGRQYQVGRSMSARVEIGLGKVGFSRISFD